MLKLSRHSAVLVCSALTVASLSGCTERKAAADVGSLPIAATAYPSPTPGQQVAVSPPQDIQTIAIHIVDGRFDADIYGLQSRPARLEVWASGGAYTFSIDSLLSPQPLHEDGVTIIGLTLPDPGRYTVRLAGPSTATAVLNVRPPGDQ